MAYVFLNDLTDRDRLGPEPELVVLVDLRHAFLDQGVALIASLAVFHTLRIVVPFAEIDVEGFLHAELAGPEERIDPPARSSPM